MKQHRVESKIGLTSAQCLVERHDVTNLLKDLFHELISLGPSAERDVCKLFSDCLVSTLGLAYLAKLNLLVRGGSVASSRESRDDFCRWLDDDVMVSLDMVRDAEVIDNGRSLLALSDIVGTLAACLDVIDEECVDQERDYLFDIPYQLAEMAAEAPDIPPFFRHSIRFESPAESSRVDFQFTDRGMSLSCRVDIGE